MFEQATLTAAPVSTRLWSTCAGVTGQALIVGCMLLAPLISPAVLPQLQSYVSLTAPGPPPPPPPPAVTTVQPRRVQRLIPFQVRPSGLVAPRFLPPLVAKIEEPPEIGVTGGPGGGVPGGVPGGDQNGVLGGLIREGAYTPPPPTARVVETAPARPAATAPTQRFRLGGNVKLASPIHRVDPIYPSIAVRARIEGVVALEGVVGIDGRIHELKVKSGHPFLVKAAVDAVMQWVYSPGTLNGDLVEVIAPITVTFRLGAR